MEITKEKERVFNTVLALYSKYGIRSITMDDIARELGMSKKTLYQHVHDKNDLVDRVIDYEIETNRQFMEEMMLAKLNAIEELIHVNKRINALRGIHSPTFYFDLKKYYPATFTRLMDYKRKRMYELVMRNLKKGKKEGLYREEMDEHVIAMLYVARIEMLSSNEIINESESASIRFIREVFLYHLHGICNDKGLEFLKAHKEKL